MEYANSADIPILGSVYRAPPTRSNPDCERIFGPVGVRIIQGAFLHGRGVKADYCDALTLVVVRPRSDLCDGDILRFTMRRTRAYQKKHQCNDDARRSHALNEDKLDVGGLPVRFEAKKGVQTRPDDREINQGQPRMLNIAVAPRARDFAFGRFTGRVRPMHIGSGDASGVHRGYRYQEHQAQCHGCDTKKAGPSESSKDTAHIHAINENKMSDGGRPACNALRSNAGGDRASLGAKT
jgi:hypothetical protein